MSYRPITEYSQEPIVVCTVCGCTIADREQHDEFHRATPQKWPLS